MLVSFINAHTPKEDPALSGCLLSKWIRECGDEAEPAPAPAPHLLSSKGLLILKHIHNDLVQDSFFLSFPEVLKP